MGHFLSKNRHFQAKNAGLCQMSKKRKWVADCSATHFCLIIFSLFFYPFHVFACFGIHPYQFTFIYK